MDGRSCQCNLGPLKLHSSRRNLDPLRFRPLSFRQRDAEHARFIGRVNVLCIDSCGKCEGAPERPVRTLNAVKILSVLFLIELALTANREDVVLNTDIDHLRIDSRKIESHKELVLRFVDIGRGYPGGSPIGGITRPPLEGGIEQAIHLILKQAYFTEGCPTHEIHGCSPLY